MLKIFLNSSFFVAQPIFCTTSTPMKDFIEALQKDENSLVVKFQIMECERQPHSGHTVRIALGKAVKVANL